MSFPDKRRDAASPLEDAASPLEDAASPLEDAASPLEDAASPLEDAASSLFRGVSCSTCFCASTNSPMINEVASACVLGVNTI